MGNSLACDFVNTQLIEDGERVELLHNDADLLRWARGAGLAVTDAAVAQASGGRLDPQAVALRAAIRDLFEARADGRRPAPDSLTQLNAFLARPRGGATLVYRKGAFARSQMTIVGATDVLERVADDAGQVLASDDGAHLRRCANHRCILMFVDRSRTGARRWCSMAVCGNRAKVAAHQRRTTSA